jgi:homospermidine synthase
MLVLLREEPRGSFRALQRDCSWRTTGVQPLGDWTPIHGRDGLFPEDVDDSDPWQFKNFRVT